MAQLRPKVAAVPEVAVRITIVVVVVIILVVLVAVVTVQVRGLGRNRLGGALVELYSTDPRQSQSKTKGF